MSMDLGDFHVYLKLEGVLDLMFVKTFLAEQTPINTLIGLIQHCKYQLKDRDNVFIDIVVLSNSRVLYARHLDQINFNNEQNTILTSIIKLMTNYKSISYPIINEIKFPSDLGTELEINYDMQEVKFHEFNNFLALIQSDPTSNITINNK